MQSRLLSIAESLGIPAALPAVRGLRVCEEAECLEVVEQGMDGREFLLMPAAAQAWRSMKAAALSDGVSLFIVSAFTPALRRNIAGLRA